MQQVDLASSLIWDIIKRAAKYAPVTYATVASNHCQNRVNKQKVGLPGLDDWGIFIAQQISKLVQETKLDVQILIPDPHDESLAFDVFGGSRYWIQGKTMDNGSSWFRLNSGQDSQPGLTCFELEKGKHFTGGVFNV